jgi:hypothetical protein
MKNKMLNRILVSIRPPIITDTEAVGGAHQIKTEAPFFGGNGFLAIYGQRLFKLTKNTSLIVYKVGTIRMVLFSTPSFLGGQYL